MTRGIVIIAVLLLSSGGAHAIGPSDDCAKEVAAANAEWRYKFPWGPSQRHGTFVDDRNGHRYEATRYDAMHRRLNQARHLCQAGDPEGARRELKAVTGWLLPGPAAGNP